MSNDDAAKKFADIALKKQADATAQASEVANNKAKLARYCSETLIPAIEQMRGFVEAAGLIASIETTKNDATSVERLLKWRRRSLPR